MNVCTQLLDIPGLDFLCWWYSWGFLLFLLIDLVCIFWIIYDSVTRKRQAIGWILAVVIPPLLLLPTLMLFFAPVETVINMLANDLMEAFFWIGLLGGLIPIIVTIGYLLTTPSQQPAPAPSSGAASQSSAASTRRVQPTPRQSGGQGTASPQEPRRQKAGAVLVGPSNRRFELFVGRNEIGRNASQQISFNDPEISSKHCLVDAKNGAFQLIDVGSTNGTKVNGNFIRGPETLYDNDEIEIGNTALTFKKM